MEKNRSFFEIKAVNMMVLNYIFYVLFSIRINLIFFCTLILNNFTSIYRNINNQLIFSSTSELFQLYVYSLYYQCIRHY